MIAVRTLALFAIVCLSSLGVAAPAGLTIAITVTDTQSRPVPGVRVSLHSKASEAPIATLTTDIKGQGSFSDLVDRPYWIGIEHDWFCGKRYRQLMHDRVMSYHHDRADIVA